MEQIRKMQLQRIVKKKHECVWKGWHGRSDGESLLPVEGV